MKEELSSEPYPFFRYRLWWPAWPWLLIPVWNVLLMINSHMLAWSTRVCIFRSLPHKFLTTPQSHAATGKVITTVSAGTKKDVDIAVDAAKKVSRNLFNSPSWSVEGEDHAEEMMEILPPNNVTDLILSRPTRRLGVYTVPAPNAEDFSISLPIYSSSILMSLRL